MCIVQRVCKLAYFCTYTPDGFDQRSIHKRVFSEPNEDTHVAVILEQASEIISCVIHLY